MYLTIEVYYLQNDFLLTLIPKCETSTSQLIDSALHAIYRLSQGRAMTKAQKDYISECLCAIASVIKDRDETPACDVNAIIFIILFSSSI